MNGGSGEGVTQKEGKTLTCHSIRKSLIKVIHQISLTAVAWPSNCEPNPLIVAVILCKSNLVMSYWGEQLPLVGVTLLSRHIYRDAMTPNYSRVTGVTLNIMVQRRKFDLHLDLT